MGMGIVELVKWKELLEYCIKYQDNIFIRIESSNCALSDLPFRLGIDYIMRWYKEGVTPTRVGEGEE